MSINSFIFYVIFLEYTIKKIPDDNYYSFDDVFLIAGKWNFNYRSLMSSI